MTAHSFADLFPQASEADWRARVDGVLKGASFEKLQSRSYDAIPVEPLYQRLTQERPRALRETAGAWAALARVDQPDAAAAHRQLLNDLENGATGLQIVFAGAVGAYGFGLRAQDLAQLLDGIALDGLAVECDVASRDQAQALADLIGGSETDPADCRISFGLNPLGMMLQQGGSDVTWSMGAPHFAQAVKDICTRGFSGPVACADGRVVHAAGGSEAQELAFMLACALSYLRALEASGLDLDAARKLIALRVACDADEILGVAKLRALRRLWARVEEACELTPHAAHIHAETGLRMMSRRDPWVNMLRTTVACFSAGLGGADRVTVLPFTQSLGLPNDFARRIARNTQSVLLEESNLWRVADPAAGAGSFETLTHQLCEAAWTVLQEIEASGGIEAMLTSGAFQRKVKDTQAQRAKAIARRKDPLTGTSEFPNVSEAPVEVLVAMPAAAPGKQAVTIEPLPVRRDAEAYEALRDRADDIANKRGKRASVFLANLGPISAFTARATYAKNFFEAGGIEAPGNDGFEDEANVVEAFKASGAKIACLCSSDALYAERAAATAQALAKAGASHIYLAGRPGEMEQSYKAAGIGGFIYIGCDVVALLDDALKLA
jgi:methylmalonyl-CoA mutase